MMKRSLLTVFLSVLVGLGISGCRSAGVSLSPEPVRMVVAASASNCEPEFTAPLVRALQTAAGRNNFAVNPALPGDLNLWINAEFTPVQALQRKVSVNLRVETGINVLNTGVPLAKQTFSFQTEKSYATVSAAKTAWEMETLHQLEPWAVKQLPGIQSQYAAALLSIQLKQPFFPIFSPMNDRIAEISDALKHTPGVVTYQLLEYRPNSYFCRYRIFYRPQELTGAALAAFAEKIGAKND